MKTRWLAAAVIGVVACTSGRLSAQAPVVRPPGVAAPTYSPYLNLLRNNSPAYINYYGLVRPEVDFRSSLYGLQQGVAANAAGVSNIDAATGLTLTGHPTSFMNTSHYFLNRGGQGTPGSAPVRGGQGTPVAASGAATAPAPGNNRGGTSAAPAPH